MMDFALDNSRYAIKPNLTDSQKLPGRFYMYSISLIYEIFILVLE